MRRSKRERLPALERLEQELYRAAVREMGGQVVVARRRRRIRRLVVASTVALVALVAAAGAARLISVGEPLVEVKDLPQELAPGSGEGVLAVTAPDPQAPLPWAVRVYTSRSGESCAIAGQLRARTLGVIRDGVFRAYRDDERGICADLQQSPLVFGTRYFASPARTLVYGRAAPDIDRLRVQGPDGTKTVAPAVGGAFLLVYEGRVPVAELGVSPVAP